MLRLLDWLDWLDWLDYLKPPKCLKNLVNKAPPAKMIIINHLSHSPHVTFAELQRNCHLKNLCNRTLPGVSIYWSPAVLCVFYS